MKFKEKVVKEKLFMDRSSTPKNAESSPLLFRFTNEQPLNKFKYDSNGPQQKKKSADKENVHGMINSVPISEPQYFLKNKMKRSMNSGKRFKTQNGYEPKLTCSRYQQEGIEKQEIAMRLSQEEKHIDHKANYRRQKMKFENVQLHTEGDRPLTFGLIKQNQPLKASIEYKQDKKIKNQVINQISKFRRSQQALLASQQYLTVGTQLDPKCSNHPQKKAKYRLITDEYHLPEDHGDTQMIYCSKCAINLLQQGFKVEQLKQKAENLLMKRSKNYGHSRVQELRKFQEKLYEIQSKLQADINRTQGLDDDLETIEKNRKQTEHVYDVMIDILKQMKIFELRKIKNQKDKKIDQKNKHEQILLEQLENVECMRGEIKEYRNKFIIMKEQQFQFLINSFMNKVTNYGVSTVPTEEPISTPQEQVQGILSSLDKALRQRLDSERSLPQSAGKNDDLICSQTKQPFRTLFPQEQYQEQSQFPNIVELSEENDSPSFHRMKRKY